MRASWAVWRAANALRAVLTSGQLGGGFQPLTRQVPQGSYLVIDADVGVLHRHPYVRVSGELPCLGEAGTVSKQFGDVTVTTGSVEVGNPLTASTGSNR